MFSQEEILSKLDGLLAYTIAQIPTLSYPNKDEFEPIFTSIVGTANPKVTGYFSADRSKFQKPLDDLGLYIHNELWQRGAKWSKPQDLGIGTNPPPEYSDLRKIFYDFDWFMGLTDQEFWDAWVYGEREEEPPPVTPVIIPKSNPHITRLVTELVLVATPDPVTGKVSETVIDQELGKIESLATWLETSMSQGGSIMLWEDMGQLIEAPSTNDIAKIVFVDRGLLEAIKLLKLPVYIPTYLRGE